MSVLPPFKASVSTNGARPRGQESGVALLATLLILAMLLALAAGMTTSIVNDTQLRGAFDRSTAGFYAAESGLDAGMGGYRDLFLAFQVPTSANFQAQTISVGNRTVTYSLADRNPTPGIPTTVQIPYGQVFGGLNAQQYVYTVNSSATNTGGDTEASVGAEFQVGYIPLFQFVAFYNNDLEIDPGATMNLNGRVHTNGNLYLGPDSNLTISTNAAIGVNYVQVTAGGAIERGRKDTGACNSSPTLQVTTASNTLQTLGCVSSSTSVVPSATLATWGGTMLNGITRISVPQPSIVARGSGDYWTKADLRIALILNYPGGWTIPAVGAIKPVWVPHAIVVLNSDGTVDTTRTASLVSFFQSAAPAAGGYASRFPNARGIFYTDAPTQSACGCTNANPSACTTAQTGAANGVNSCYSPQFPAPPPSPSPTPAPSAARIYSNDMRSNDQDPRRGGFYNWREGRWTYLLNINAGDLLQWNINQGGPLFNPSETTDGGIVLYATVYDYNSPSANLSNNFGFGVRLFGSQTLPFPSLGSLGNDPTGLTVASDRPIYVLGDYNAPPGAAGVYNPTTLWQPASIIGDAMNIMSNNYFQNAASNCANDCQSNRSLGDASRAVTQATTINAAFLAGVDTTTSGNYNGGLENYPRFHESWSGQTLNYLGSFVSLGTPQTVSGAWCGTGGTFTGSPPAISGCNIYNPPNRVWNFDPNFQNVAYLPPLTPRFVYVQQIRFTQNFK